MSIPKRKPARRVTVRDVDRLKRRLVNVADRVAALERAIRVVMGRIRY